MTRKIPLMTGKSFPYGGTFPDLSKTLDLDLAGDLDRMARVVAELLAAPVDLDLSLSTVSTKAAPGPDVKPSSRR